MPGDLIGSHVWGGDATALQWGKDKNAPPYSSYRAHDSPPQPGIIWLQVSTVPRLIQVENKFLNVGWEQRKRKVVYKGTLILSLFCHPGKKITILTCYMQTTLCIKYSVEVNFKQNWLQKPDLVFPFPV